MPDLSDETLKVLPEDRDEALQSLFDVFWKFWEKQWQPGGIIDNFGGESWGKGWHSAWKSAMEYFRRNFQLVDRVSIPDPDESGWDTTIEA